jgi:hypothetical protein
MRIANLWNKNLFAGDIIIAIDKVDSRWGPLNTFTVERTDEAVIAATAHFQAEREEAERREQVEQDQKESARIIREERWEIEKEAAEQKRAATRERTAERKRLAAEANAEQEGTA